MKQKQIVVGLGILVNDRHQLLVSLRNDPDHPKAHLKWELPGGAVEFGETIEETVIREMKEELGVSVELLDYPPLLGSSVWDHETLQVHVLLIGLLCKTSHVVAPNHAEVADIRWIDAEEIDQLEHLPVCDIFVKQATRLLGSKKA
ncbi:NUDIX domain-containing protein [Candidatus Roizmanbacteria bacterium]|nr:NUDIX domain-containing protein [Candidatus Roizmanbacteria bacterium]